VKAIERIEEIKERRQNQFIMNRLHKGTEDRKEADLKEINQFLHLIKAPHGNLMLIKWIIDN
jgi:large subunit ribosomal protein L24e